MGVIKIVFIVIALIFFAVILWLAYFYYKRAVQHGTGPFANFVTRSGYSSSPPVHVAAPNPYPPNPGYSNPNPGNYYAGEQNYPMPQPQPQPQPPYHVISKTSTTYTTNPTTGNVTYSSNPPMGNATFTTTTGQQSYNPNFPNQGFQYPPQPGYTYNDNPPPYPG